MLNTGTTDQVRTIVVGVDGSPHSEAALRWAIRLAGCMGSEIVAVNAVPPPTSAWYGLGYPAAMPPELLEERELVEADARRHFVEEWCRPLRDSGLHYRTVQATGRAASLIAAAADDVGAELVVVGRRGRGGMAELLLGSVSHELILHCAHPVLVVTGKGAPVAAGAANKTGGTTP